MKVAALCAGYGGLELGLEHAGVDVDLRWYCEIDPHASKVLAHHHPGVPNHGDLTAPFEAEPVDLVAAGFPCQPVSAAGSQKGVEDERWIIDDVCRVARLSGAEWLLLENVRGLFTANDGDALGRVCQAMAHHGFSRWEWTTVRASDIGAPHRRERWFCLARNTTRTASRAEARREDEPFKPVGNGPADGPGSRTVADPDDSGRSEQRRPVPARSELATAEHRGDVTSDSGSCGWHRRTQGEKLGVAGQDGLSAFGGESVDLTAGSGGSDNRFGQYGAAVARWETVMGAAPDPTDNGRLNPRFVEWLMGVPAGHVTGPLANRRQALKCLGNGVVPQQAALAVGLLAREFDR